MENKPSTPEKEYPSKLDSKLSQKDDNSDDFLLFHKVFNKNLQRLTALQLFQNSEESRII